MSTTPPSVPTGLLPFPPEAPTTYLERGPAAGTVAALQTLEELGVPSLMRVDVEA